MSVDEGRDIIPFDEAARRQRPDRSRQADISHFFTWHDGLPYPQWDLVRAWAESRRDAETRRRVWIDAGRQWLIELASALGADYDLGESEHFMAVACGAAADESLLAFAERCRARLMSSLGDVVRFQVPGKQIVIVLGRSDDYYRYIAAYYADGEHGGSGGVHIRQGYPHVALLATRRWKPEGTLAHELTHVALHHCSMPQWLEEGLACLFECDMAGSRQLEVNAAMAAEHEAYWGREELDAFWRGEGFSRPTEVQGLSYQLAQILARLLIDDSQPRWFGLVREPQRRFFAFLREASQEDCGEAACRKHLGYGIADLAARFLGPGAWAPSL